MKAVSSVLFISLLAVSALASEKVQITSMQAVIDKVEELKRVNAAQDILLVFDIDNTLLTTEKSLGGDAWFNWQESKLKNRETADLVAPDFDGLLRVQGYLFSLTQMRPPEKMTPPMVRAFQAAGHPVFLLTSRGWNYENLTEQELTRNGYDSSLTAPGPKGGYAPKFLPYDVKNPEAACLTSQELAQWGLKDAKLSVYQNGVFFTSGQHKGAMLRSILCKTGKTFKNIVFVDDTEKHVDRVLLAYQNMPSVNVVSMRYGAMDAQVEGFNRSDKRAEIEAWEKIKTVLGTVFERAF